MRLIDKLQQGGGMPAFVSYTNVPQPQPTAPYTSSQSTEEQEQESLLDKNMIKFLYENGIPSDVESFIDRSGIFSSDLTSNPFRKEDSMIQYKTILKMLPRIKAESERFKSAMTQAEKNDGLNEIAVTDRGLVITMTSDGSFDSKRIQDVDFNKEKVLTNAELANYRANDVSGAFNTGITDIISNGIGIPKITEYIRSITDKLGSSSVSSDGYVSQKSGRVLKGLAYLSSLNPSQMELAGMSVDGMYKVSGMDKSQAQQAQQAINYIISTLPKNMATVLQAKAATTFGDNSVEGVKKLVTMLTASALKGEHTFSLDYQKNIDADGGTKSSEGKDDNIIDPAKMFVLGLGDKQMYTINNGNSYNLQVYGNKGIVTDRSGKPLGRSTLSDVAESTYAGALDLKNASMGDQLLDFVQTDRVALNGSGVVGADLPIDIVAKQSGVLKPDLDALKRMEAADEKIRDEGINSYEEMNKIYASHNLPFKFDENGNINFNSYARFAIFDAFADESAFLEDASLAESLDEVVDENTRRGVASILKQADKDYKISNGGFMGLGSGTHIYSGSVYVPIISNILNVAAGSGHYPTLQGNDAHKLDALYQRDERLKSYNRPPTLSSLNQ